MKQNEYFNRGIPGNIFAAMKVYFIAGLAADERVFKHIQLPAPCTPVHLQWITPVSNETLAAYALRLAAAIDTREPFGLIGLSMGGMMAVEIAKHLTPARTVLISSVPAASQLPSYFKAAGRIGLHKWVPVQWVKSASLAKRVFTLETPEDKEMLRALIRESDNAFISWAMGAILQWKENEAPQSYVHIHGSRDAVLPLRNTRPTHVIAGGGHLMIMNRASEINRILSDVFAAEKS
ncbi:MAG TPA: alpha/beta hydrolase [Chitinophagaceae bacterium]|nr:alpha/beta hydrolase [Chitinophagaceae bacterium]